MEVLDGGEEVAFTKACHGIVYGVHYLVMLYTHYPSDLIDSEWAIIGQLVPQPKTNGRAATISRRALLNAMFYVTKTGCG